MRDFSTEIPSVLLSAIQQGVMRMRYRGVPCMKSPFDMSLYLLLLERLAPRTVFEIGTRFGGSALWFADMLSCQGVPARIISVDIAGSASFEDSRIDFIRGDALNLADALDEKLLASCPRPWLVVEDSAHSYDATIAVLRFFDRWLGAGDYIVVEDGIVAHMPEEFYQQYEDGPNRAVAEFMCVRDGSYELDTQLCDFFGRNATYNPNGWLRRV